MTANKETDRFVNLAKLIDDNVAMLEQAGALIDQLVMRAEGDGTVGYANGVGPHLRHILDHFDRFFAGLDNGVIDYDARARCQQTELSPGFGLRRVRGTVQRLQGVDAAQLPDSIKVRLCTDADCAGEVTPSSPARELQFLQSHGVHHFALMRRILDERGVRTDDDFGKAPATLSAERASA